MMSDEINHCLSALHGMLSSFSRLLEQEMERGIRVRSVEGTTISIFYPWYNGFIRKKPVCDQKESRLSMFAEKADGFHRSSTNDSGALMSICRYRVVS